MIHAHDVVRWSAAGVPPAYVERRWRADVPHHLRPAFEELLRRSRFFELPSHLGPNPTQGRDMGAYSITVEVGGRSHTVQYTDASATRGVADLRAWILEHLQQSAAPDE
jgi:hypothetical protein